jgi:hypothetical protein
MPGKRLSLVWLSLWQTPQAWTLILTVPAPGLDQKVSMSGAAAELDLIVALPAAFARETARTDRTTKHARGLMALGLSGDQHRPAHPEAVSP